jgi:hypothetical protein
MISSGIEPARGWRKFHNEELHNSYLPPIIVRMRMSREVRGVGHVARVGKKRNTCRDLVERLHEMDC